MSKSSLEEMLEEYLNPRPKNVEAAEDMIGGGAAIMPYHEDFQAESASKGTHFEISNNQILRDFLFSMSRWDAACVCVSLRACAPPLNACPSIMHTTTTGKVLRKSVKEALPLRASDLSMGTRYHGSKVQPRALRSLADIACAHQLLLA